MTKNETKISAENERKPAKFQEPRKAKKRAETVAGARFLGFRAYRSYVKKRLKTSAQKGSVEACVLHSNFASFLVDFSSILGPSWAPKSIKNRSKI